jgi:polyisoprenoid-binding protein YceI
MQTQPGFPPSTPQLGHYDIDTENSAVRFRTRHMFGLGPVRGGFSIISGSADVAEPLTDSAVSADIGSASFRTGNPQRDGMVRSARFLDAKNFPVISFRNGRISADGSTISGELTVREVTRPVSISVQEAATSGGGFTVTASVRIDRTEFGLTAMPGITGRYLDLTVEATCVRR